MAENQPTSSIAAVDLLSTKDGYDLWAAIYDEDGNPLIALEEPQMDKLLGDVRGLTVADIGCGTGRHAIRLALAGATVDAIDFSAGMLERARKKARGLSIRFQVRDLTEPLPFANETFDRVVCGLVIDHIPDLIGLFREMGRICRSSGFVVISVMHPAMMLRGVQARFHDPVSGKEIRPASCPHQLSDYVMAVVKSGLVIEHMREHAVDEELASRLERAKRYVGWPLLCLLQLRKSSV